MIQSQNQPNSNHTTSESIESNESKVAVDFDLFGTAIKNAFVADSLSMPVHWYYRVSDIHRDFPDGIYKFHPAPSKHPSSIMSLHSKQQGGRQTMQAKNQQANVVGDVILKDKAQFWDQANVHYHQGMQAGENTLNTHTVWWLLQSIHASENTYTENEFLDLYIKNMTAEQAVHPDTYAESYHRGFFANWSAGHAPENCGAVTHDTSSVGGLVRIGPLVLFLLSQNNDQVTIKSVVARHLKLTHPDDKLNQVAFQYVDLIIALIQTDQLHERIKLVEKYLNQVAGKHFKAKPAAAWADNQVVGGLFSTACYITDSWPAVLYLASKYPEDTMKALQVNAELGGDNVHRGAVLALILSLINHQSLVALFDQLSNADAIDELLKKTIKPSK